MAAEGPYALAFQRPALKFLGTVPAKIYRQIMTKVIDLCADPHPQGSKKLEDVTDHGRPVYRDRAGDYRILYSLRENIILILDIDDRKDVYR
jgi:mRNA-degrading endonuclease RelE of RelBE toxin-antitoxin system